MTPAPLPVGGEGALQVQKRRRGALPGWVYPMAALAVVAVLWDLAIRVFDVPPFILPAPLAVLGAIVADFPWLVEHAGVTLREVLGGFALSVLMGVSLALLIVSSKLVEKTVHPLLVGSLAVPKIAIAPIFIIWFGFGIAPKIFMAFLLSLFPIVIGAVVGLRAVETEKLHLARSMGATGWQSFRHIRLPNAMPALFGGLKVGITLSVTGAIVGEFIGADRGLGRLIVVANGALDTTALFAAIVVLALMAIVLYLIVDGIERVVVRWHVSQRSPPPGGY